jgi:hypothetical protein
MNSIGVDFDFTAVLKASNAGLQPTRTYWSKKASLLIFVSGSQNWLLPEMGGQPYCLKTLFTITTNCHENK